MQFEEIEIECKLDAYSAQDTLLFKKGGKYRVRINKDNYSVFDELGAMRPLMQGGKPTELMKTYFKPLQGG
jgi:hypothetical protein